jgi:holo-[acyl-carrier protein] synthase
MEIFGIGTDIVNVKRIEKILKKNKKSFLAKVFTKNEIKIFSKYKSNQPSKIALKFAAKEALSKSLGTGIGAKVSFLDVEVLNETSGKPYFRIIKKSLKKISFKLSLSDDYPWAIAFVVAIKI